MHYQDLFSFFLTHNVLQQVREMGRVTDKYDGKYDALFGPTDTGINLFFNFSQGNLYIQAV